MNESANELATKPTNTRRAFSISTSVFAVNSRTLKVVLIHHKRLGVWLPFGGEFEVLEGIMETPLECALRELEEESGYRKSEVKLPVDLSTPERTPPGLLGYEEHMAGSKGLHQNFVFHALVPDRDPVSDGSWTEFRWTDVASPPKELPGGSIPRNVIQFLEIIGKKRR